MLLEKSNIAEFDAPTVVSMFDMKPLWILVTMLGMMIC